MEQQSLVFPSIPAAAERALTALTSESKLAPAVFAHVRDMLETWAKCGVDKVIVMNADQWLGVIAFIIQNTCPRCTGYIPNGDKPGKHEGARSRTDRDPGRATEICSACGDAEGTIAFAASKNGEDPVQALLKDRAGWLLPEVARPVQVKPKRKSRRSRKGGE